MHNVACGRMIILLSADDVNYWAAYHSSPEDEITVGESTPHSQCLFFPWKAKQTYLTSKSQGNKSIEAMFNSFWVCVSVAGAKIFRGNGTRVMIKVFIKQKTQIPIALIAIFQTHRVCLYIFRFLSGYRAKKGGLVLTCVPFFFRVWLITSFG